MLAYLDAALVVADPHRLLCSAAGQVGAKLEPSHGYFVNHNSEVPLCKNIETIRKALAYFAF